MPRDDWPSSPSVRANSSIGLPSSFLQELRIELSTYQYHEARPIKPNAECERHPQGAIALTVRREILEVDSEQIRKSDAAAYCYQRPSQRAREFAFHIRRNEIEELNRENGARNGDGPPNIGPEVAGSNGRGEPRAQARTHKQQSKGNDEQTSNRQRQTDGDATRLPIAPRFRHIIGSVKGVDQSRKPA